MVNKDNESFENNLKRIFTEEIEVPYCVKNKIIGKRYAYQ